MGSGAISFQDPDHAFKYDFAALSSQLYTATFLSFFPIILRFIA